MKYFRSKKLAFSKCRKYIYNKSIELLWITSTMKVPGLLTEFRNSPFNLAQSLKEACFLRSMDAIDDKDEWTVGDLKIHILFKYIHRIVIYFISIKWLWDINLFIEDVSDCRSLQFCTVREFPVQDLASWVPWHEDSGADFWVPCNWLFFFHSVLQI